MWDLCMKRVAQRSLCTPALRMAAGMTSVPKRRVSPRGTSSSWETARPPSLVYASSSMSKMGQTAPIEVSGAHFTSMVERLGCCSQ